MGGRKRRVHVPRRRTASTTPDRRLQRFHEDTLPASEAHAPLRDPGRHGPRLVDARRRAAHDRRARLSDSLAHRLCRARGARRRPHPLRPECGPSRAQRGDRIEVCERARCPDDRREHACHEWSHAWSHDRVPRRAEPRRRDPAARSRLAELRDGCRTGGRKGRALPDQHRRWVPSRPVCNRTTDQRENEVPGRLQSVEPDRTGVRQSTRRRKRTSCKGSTRSMACCAAPDPSSRAAACAPSVPDHILHRSRTVP